MIVLMANLFHGYRVDQTVIGDLASRGYKDRSPQTFGICGKSSICPIKGKLLVPGLRNWYVCEWEKRFKLIEYPASCWSAANSGACLAWVFDDFRKSIDLLIVCVRNTGF